MFIFRSCQSTLKSIQNVFEIGSDGGNIQHEQNNSIKTTVEWFRTPPWTTKS